MALDLIPLSDGPKQSSKHGEISPKRTSKLQEKPSAPKQKHPALQNIKFFTYFYFCGSFYLRGSRSVSNRPKQMRIRIHNTEKKVKEILAWLRRLEVASGGGRRQDITGGLLSVCNTKHCPSVTNYRQSSPVWIQWSEIFLSNDLKGWIR